MASDGASVEDQDRASRQQPILPSIFDVLGNEMSAPLVPRSSSMNFSQRPYVSRSYSYPSLHVNPWVPLVDPCSTTSTGPKLRPMTSVRGEPVPHIHQLASPPSTISRSTSVCSTDAEDRPDLKSRCGILDRPRPDYDAAVRSATKLLQDSCVPPAFPQGWFRPDNEYNNRLEGELVGLSLSELTDAFFFRDEGRAVYGDRVIRPRRQMPTEPVSSENPNPQERLDPQSVEKLEKKKGVHQKQEEARRDRHRNCQHDSHERCPEVAARCGAEHARNSKLTTRPQAGKGPGKDEQLYSSIYTQELAGKLVQALNERRKRAEDTVHVLLQLLQQQRSPSISVPGPHQDHHKVSQRASFSQPRYVGVKRSRDETGEESQQTWTRIRHDSDEVDSRGSLSTRSESM